MNTVRMAYADMLWLLKFPLYSIVSIMDSYVFDGGRKMNTK